MPTDDTLTWLPHVRVQIGGVLGNPAQEIWSNSFRYIKGSTTAPEANALQAAADAIAGPVSAWIARPESLIHDSVHFTYVKVAWVLSNGRQRDANTAQHDVTPATSGSDTTSAIWEQTYVLTFRTEVARGRAHAGRIYPPVAGRGPALASQAYCSDAEAAGMGHSGAQLLTEMGAAMATAIEPGGPTGGFYVISPGSSLRGTQPVAHSISRVVCDRVADIMHSRTNRVPRLEAASTPVPLN